MLSHKLIIFTIIVYLASKVCTPANAYENWIKVSIVNPSSSKLISMSVLWVFPSAYIIDSRVLVGWLSMGELAL